MLGEVLESLAVFPAWVMIAIDSDPEHITPVQSIRTHPQRSESAGRIKRHCRSSSAECKAGSVFVGQPNWRGRRADGPRGLSPRYKVSKRDVLAITSCETSYRSALQPQRSLRNAERWPTVANLVPCSKTAMSSERDPLLTTPPQRHANAQNEAEIKNGRGLGPLEVSRSNRNAILAGIWMANFLGVRCIVSR